MVQGDILFLHMNKDPIRAGEIVVYNVEVSLLSCVGNLLPGLLHHELM